MSRRLMRVRTPFDGYCPQVPPTAKVSSVIKKLEACDSQGRISLLAAEVDRAKEHLLHLQRLNNMYSARWSFGKQQLLKQAAIFSTSTDRDLQAFAQKQCRDAGPSCFERKDG